MARTNALILCLLAFAAHARAQMTNPVYADLSPVARDTLAQASEFVRVGNEAEAARELQRLLDEQPDRVVPAGDDVFRAVRDQVHATILASPALLERYRLAEEARAAEMLAAGTIDGARAAENTRLLTRAGFEGALRVAQHQLEAARFDAARITLEQLENHPDRRADPALGARVARLLHAVDAYLDQPGDRAARWAAEAGLALEPGPRAPRPPALDLPLLDLRTPAGAPPPDDIPTRPLWSARIEPPELARAASEDGTTPFIPNDFRDATSLWIIPTVRADTLYINDGTWVTARDRFTLRPIWSVQPMPDEDVEPWAAREVGANRGVARAVEDTNSVTLAGNILVATTGLANDGSRDGDPRTHALDTATGRTLWSVHVQGLDPQLESSSVRGPAMVAGDTVILMARKAPQTRRVVSVYLVGIAINTGELRWVRLIASAGALPFIRERRITDTCTLADGIVYCADQLGVIAAVEAETGRPVWVRRIPATSIGDATSLPWRWNAPIIDGDSIVTLSPDHREVLRLERATGQITARRAAGLLGEPDYLLRVGDTIAAVGGARIAFLPISDIAAGRIQLSRPLGPPEIAGRVVIAGDQLLVPLTRGVAAVRADRPGEEAALRSLERMGNVLPSPSQFLVIDGAEVHSYLTWPVAQNLLRERMAADPANPDPAVTYAELAYRAAHHEEIAPAADKALAAILLNPAATAPARARLFESLRAMVEATQERWNVDPVAGAHPALDHASLSAVIDRMGSASRSAEDRVTHLLALGRLREAELKPAVAAEAYQRVLADPSLAAAPWRGPRVRIRADVEAARRVRQLLIDNGAAIYAVFDAESRAAFDALGAKPTPAALEALARRYPAAAVNPGVWALAADAHEAAGRGHASVAALREGLAAAELSRAAGRRTEPDMLGEIAGRLINRLRALDQVFAAAQLLGRLRTDHRALALTDHGVTLDADRLASDLAASLSAVVRLPRIGPEIAAEVQTIEGWAVLEPVRSGRIAASEHVMLVSARSSMVALWGPPTGAPAAPAEAAARHLAMLWNRPFQGQAPRLLRVDPQSVYLFWTNDERGPVIERIDAITGRTLWRTEPFSTVFVNDARNQERAALAGTRVDTPLDGAQDASDLIFAMDEQVIVLADRVGRLAAFDPRTGKPLWRTLSDVNRVYDLGVGGGLVAIGGARAPADDLGAVAGHRPAAVVHDAVTGQIVHRLDTLSEPPRWLRLVGATTSGKPGAGLVLGLRSEIIAVDPSRATTNWVIPGGPAFESLDAWIFGDRLFILDQAHGLWLASLATGRVADQPLDTFERLVGAWPIEAAEIRGADGTTNVAFMTSRGVLVFDPGPAGGPPLGRLVGIDALGGDQGRNVLDAGTGRQFLIPVPTERSFVTMETWQNRLPDGRPAYALHLLDARTGRLQGVKHNLVLWEPPRRLAVVDGRILVTSGAVDPITLVYNAPQIDP